MKIGVQNWIKVAEQKEVKRNLMEVAVQNQIQNWKKVAGSMKIGVQNWMKVDDQKYYVDFDLVKAVNQK